MWQNELYTPTTVCVSFQDWLSSDEGKRRRQGWVNEPSLLDIVGAWLGGHEDDIIWIPSYETFLVGLVFIINAWNEGDKKYIELDPLWLDPETGEARVVSNLLPPFEEREDHEAEIGIGHSLLNRSAFDGARWITQQKQQYSIEQQLARLLSDGHPK